MKIIFFITLIISIAFRPLMPLVDYALNYNKITTELCENLDKPELLCNGFCYLQKEVKQTSNSFKEKTIKNVVKISEALISQKQEINTRYSFENFKESLNEYYQNIYKKQLVKIIFHPPIT